MKKLSAVFLALILAVLSPLCVYASENSGITLSENGQTDYVIVRGADCTEAERTAADTLSDYLSRITGADFPVVDDSAGPCEKELVVGRTNRLPDSADTEYEDDDTVHIFSDGEKLFFTGGEKRGALYSVYTFLEDTLGCRWFTHDLTVVPESPDLSVRTPFEFLYTPQIKLRQTYWMFSTIYPDFCAAHKLHGIMAYLPENLGGARFEMAVNSVHTMQWIITADMFEEHPEYFGADGNGVRSVTRQPCFTNEDVLRIATEYALNFIGTYETVLSISQNDGMDFCQCEKCREFNSAHGGTDSAALLNFVNSVARAVNEKYPGRRIETLAYQNSQTPPENLAVEDNVVIRVCPISACVLHDLDDPSCPSNAKFDRDLTDWAKLTENIYVWDYSTNFQYIYALFPNITTLQNRYRYFASRNVISVFENGCGEMVVPAEFHELRTYLVLKLLWDPDTDIERHIKEFCDAYYGEAADDVISFIKLFEDRVKGYNALTFKNCHMACSDGGENLEAHSSLSERDIKKLNKLIEQAKGKVTGEEQMNHLYGLELSWRFFKNATFAGEFNWFNFRNEPEKEAEKLFTDMKNYGVTYLAEAGAVPFGDRTPDFRVRPTYWFLQEDEMTPSVRTQAVLLPLANRILRAVFAVALLFSKED